MQGGISVNVPIQDALRDGSGAYAARDIMVALRLQAASPVEANTPLLYESVYAVFRLLPRRIEPGSIFYVSTADREDGALIWWRYRETSTSRRSAPTPLAPRADGPDGDLIDLSFAALERLCRARLGYVREPREPLWTSLAFDEGGSTTCSVEVFLPRAEPSSAPRADGVPETS